MNRLLGVSLMLCALPAWAQDESPLTPIEPEAVELLQAAASHLAKTKTFLMRSKLEYDSVQEDGEKLTFGSTRTTVVERPNRARIETQRRDGRRTELIIDGERLWLYTPDQNAFGSAAQSGDVSASLDFVARVLGVPQPLSDLLAADPYQEMAEGLTSAMVVGDAEIDGVACVHAAYRNDVADFQLWISQTNEHLMQRLIITYRDAPGQPQFRADLVEFDANPKIGPDTFVFSPPADAERLRFIVDTGPDTPTQEE